MLLFFFQPPSLLLEPASKEENGWGLLVFFFFPLSVLCSLSPRPFLDAASDVRKSHGGACRLWYMLGALSAAPLS